MDKSTISAQERRNQTLEILSTRPKVLVPDLCKRFGVSPVTIRNDLSELEKEGKLKRTYGGAIRALQPENRQGAPPAPDACAEQKRRIAAAALGMVRDGQTIALDAGSTTMELARLLPQRKHLTIVTNDLHIARYLETHAPTCSLLMVGGSLRQGGHCTTGPMALASFDHIYVDTAFLGARGLSLEKGLTTPGDEQAEVKKKMLQIAAEKILLLDSSKFGCVTFVKFAGFSGIDKIVTDAGIPADHQKQLTERYVDLELIVV